MGHCILGFVVMPNHVHALIAFKKSETSINTVIGNGKRFMAYEIVKRLKREGESELLADLAKRVEAGRKARRKLHDVWELSFDWKHCTTEVFMKRKLDYYHIGSLRHRQQSMNTALQSFIVRVCRECIR